MDRRDDAGEIVVGQHHVGRLLGHVGSGDAHGNADIGTLQRRRIVDAVAGHRHDMVIGFHRLDDARLVLRRNAAAYLQALGALGQLGVAQRFDFAAGQHQAIRTQHADVARDRFRRILVVAGDHHALEASPVRDLQCLDDFLTRRIDHAEQADEDQIALDRFRRRRFRHRIQRPAGHCQHAQRGRGHVTVLRQNRRPRFRRQRDNMARLDAPRAQIENDVGRALDESNDRSADGRNHIRRTVDLVDGAHPLAIGIERDFLYSRQPFRQLIAPETGLGRSDDQRRFGRVADDAPGLAVGLITGLIIGLRLVLPAFVQHGVIAQQRAPEQQVHIRIVLRREALPIDGKLSLRHVAFAGNLEIANAGAATHDGHLILGQRPGLVRTDDGGAAQGFDGR